MGKVHFGYLITVCAAANENCPRTFPGMGMREHWEFDDPVAFEGSEEEKLQKFRDVRDQIEHHIRQWLADRDL
jgi:arsenate reductase